MQAQGNFAARRALEREASQDGHLRMARLRVRPVAYHGGKVSSRRSLDDRHGLRRVAAGRAGPRRRRPAADEESRSSSRARQLGRDRPGVRGGGRPTVAELAGDASTWPMSSRPADGGGAVSEDGHALLVDFEITGRTPRRRRTSTPSEATVAAAQSRAPGLRGRAVRRRAAPTRSSTTPFAGDLHKAEKLSLPLTLIILAVAFGALVAAGLPVLLAMSAVMATMGLVAIPSQVFPIDGNATR